MSQKEKLKELNRRKSHNSSIWREKRPVFLKDTGRSSRAFEGYEAFTPVKGSGSVGYRGSLRSPLVNYSSKLKRRDERFRLYDVSVAKGGNRGSYGIVNLI